MLSLYIASPPGDKATETKIKSNCDTGDMESGITIIMWSCMDLMTPVLYNYYYYNSTRVMNMHDALCNANLHNQLSRVWRSINTYRLWRAPNSSFRYPPSSSAIVLLFLFADFQHNKNDPQPEGDKDEAEVEPQHTSNSNSSADSILSHEKNKGQKIWLMVLRQVYALLQDRSSLWRDWCPMQTTYIL